MEPDFKETDFKDFKIPAKFRFRIIFLLFSYDIAYAYILTDYFSDSRNLSIFDTHF